MLLLALVVFPASDAAFAGPNRGGMLILHCDETLQFSGDGDFNGYAQLYDAKDAVIQVPGDEQGVVYFILAAFDDFASPRLKGIEFGIELSSSRVEPVRWGPSGEISLEVPDNNWPSSGSGTGIAWSEPLTRRINEIYWFCGYAYPGQTVKLVEHPRHTGIMVDDSVPNEEDEIAGYGMLGFGVKGFNPMSDEEATGACCSSSGQCTLQTESGCALYPGRTYLGDNTFCSPNPCEPGSGACCILTDCRLLKWDECIDASGLFMGEGVSCLPTPCDFTRVETTWGSLKTLYRP